MAMVRKLHRRWDGFWGCHVSAIADIRQMRYLPPYSPDFNPIEMAFSKLKALLRKAAARTIDDLWHAIANGVDQFTPDECKNYFRAAGYDPVNHFSRPLGIPFSIPSITELL